MARIARPLTSTEIDRAKPQEKDYSLSDGYGMYLLIKKNGTKVWRFQYYRPNTKKRALISLGIYPTVTLANARKKRDEYRELLANNVDPQDHISQVKTEALQQQTHLFSSVCEDWLRIKENEVACGTLKSVTYRDIVKRIERHLLPHFAKMNIQDITAPLAIQKLRPLERRGKLDTLHRMVGYLNNIMTHAVNSGIINSNPVAGISKVFIKPVSTNNPTLRPEELPELFQKLQTSSISLDTRCVIEFMLLTATRAGTATGAKWEEINFDERLWEIPKDRMKGRIGKVQDFTVPLSKQAIQLLQTMRRYNGNSPYVFPSAKTPNKAMNVETPNTALKRMGFSGRLTAHGLRSIFSTCMNEAEFNAEIIEVCLAHFEYSSVRGAYNRSKYLEQRFEYMQWWGDFVQEKSDGLALCSVN